ncbi:hypothetical protein V6N11_024942 [Hibiscus sabdariffa]|uniref:Uncharacterized protein n=1 Tax=Hibiscus sabdariffa TaxID=183260 RepID=A0ABR2QNY3_9ROSI
MPTSKQAFEKKETLAREVMEKTVTVLAADENCNMECERVGSDVKFPALKKLIRDHRVEMSDYCEAEAIGNSGRVVSIWDKNMFLAELKISDQRFILVRGWWIQNGTLAMIINVYAPCVISEHIDRWALLINRRQSDNIF